MKCTRTLFLVILCTNFLMAQSKDFPTANATWNFSIRDGADYYPYFNSYSLTGDTIIDALTYQSINGGENGFFRTEGKKVYFLPKDSTQAYLTYDFDLVEGDTFISYWQEYDFSPNNNEPDTFLVERVDSILTNDGYRKRWTFMDSLGSAYAQWVEGIGSYSSLTSPTYNGINGDHYLFCFKNGDDWIVEDSVPFYAETSDMIIAYLTCDGYIVATDELDISSSEIKVSPNPFFDKFELLNPEIPFGADLHIYSVQGQLLQTINYQGKVTLPELASGTYILSFVHQKIRYSALLQKL